MIDLSSSGIEGTFFQRGPCDIHPVLYGGIIA